MIPISDTDSDWSDVPLYVSESEDEDGNNGLGAGFRHGWSGGELEGKVTGKMNEGKLGKAEKMNKV